MLSNPQKALLKRAQREAGLSDEEYRDALEIVAGVRSSTDRKLTNRDLDRLLAYFEAIWRRGVAADELQPSGNTTAVFRQPGFWASKNTNQETSRDRFNGRNQTGEIATLEAKLSDLGYGPAYAAAIREKICHGSNDAHALHLYAAALARTLKSKARHAETANNPF